jgi:D-sedoheptulose 7-phosphate isomerase
MNTNIKEIIEQSINTKKQILNDDSITEQILLAVSKIVTSLHNKGKLFLAGNGGSAADSQHIAAEFVVRLYEDRQAFPAMALTTDSSILTAIGNDYGFNSLFARQLQAHARDGDIFIAISTSGNSENIIQAIEYCKRNNITSIGLAGKTGGKLNELCDVCIKIPSLDTARIQESHILIGHIICLLVEQQLVQ